MAGQPGILFVNSKITSDTLSAPTFTSWYEGVHIPDIFVTSGIKTALRYVSTAPDAVERPYLALYPVRDVGWLSSDEFKSIPVHSDVLPNESGAIFELADFDTRYYVTLGRKGGDGVKGPANSIVAVTLDSTTDDIDSLCAASLPQGSTPVRSRVLKLNFSRQNRNADADRAIPKPPGYLVLHEFGSAPDIGALQAREGVTAASFNLLKAFGDVNAEF